jgi:hypothetical protein
MKKYLAIIVLQFLMLGCAVNPENLGVSSLNQSFTLEEKIEHKGRGIESLSKGTYVSNYEDSEGVYFKGPDKCVLITGVNGEIFVKANGGLWYPKENSSKKPKIFAYIERENNNVASEQGILIKKLAENDIGKISFGKEISDLEFLSKIKVIVNKI